MVIDESVDDNHNPAAALGQYRKQTDEEASHEYGNNSSGGIRMVKDNKPSVTS